MCIWFGYNCWIIFYHFFHFVNFQPHCIDSGYLVSATPHAILYQSFWNFAHDFSMVWRCACGLDIILAFIFVTFSTLRTSSFSDLRFYENVVTVGTLWAQLLIQFYTDLFETLYMFSPWSWNAEHVPRGVQMSNFLILQLLGYCSKWCIKLSFLMHRLWYLADLCLDSISIKLCFQIYNILFVQILTFFSQMTIFRIIEILKAISHKPT